MNAEPNILALNFLHHELDVRTYFARITAMSKDKVFVIGIKGIVIKNDKILLLKKLDQLGHFYWDVPGGKIKQGETYSETLKREIVEEIPSIKSCEVKDLLGEYFLDRDLKDGNGLLRLFYLVEVEMVNVAISDEHSEFQWFSIEKLKSLYVVDDTSKIAGEPPYIEKQVFTILSKSLNSRF